MKETHEELFASFKVLHDKYADDPEQWQEEFNREGEKIVEVIRQYEKMLCAESNAGQYSKFSSNLADKFWTAVRTYFPKIDFVGVK